VAENGSIPLNGTTQPVDIEEEGQSQSNHGQTMAKKGKEKCSSSVAAIYTAARFTFDNLIIPRGK